MTYERFCDIWEAMAPNNPPGMSGEKIIQEGSSPQLIDALIAVANGDHSHFDRINERLAAYDAAH